MKKIILILVLSLSIGTLVANPVDPATARKAASTFLSSLGVKNNSTAITDITDATPFSHMYVFDIDGGNGFIVISADDNTEPVLAYSLSSPFVTGDMPDHVRAWFAGYEQRIAINSIATPDKEVRRQWEQLERGLVEQQSKAIVGPFLTTKWNQSPLYNKYCPYDSVGGGIAVAGCTAIATAQIMKYFNHPAQGYGNCTYFHNKYGELSANYNVNYQWDSMPDTLKLSSTEGQVDAVATLVYHIGVAVSMDYNYKGSGGKTASYGYGGEPSSENAFKYNFKYSPYVWTAFRIDYTLNEWKELLKNEIDNNRPVLYAGYDEVQSGHAFVCDGYRQNNSNISFHFNWGWGGAYDGYYSIDDLNPSSFSLGNSGYHFDLFATATMGIETFDGFDPASSTTITTSTEGILGASASDGSVSGAGTYNFGDTLTLYATANNEYTRFVQWSDGCRYNPRSTVATGGNLSFTALFAPIKNDTVRYHTTDNSMNRASNLPYGLGCDSVWGIKIPATAIKAGARLDAVRFMGRKAANHTLTIYDGTDSPERALVTDTFFDTLPYAYTFHTHNLSTPIDVEAGKSLWIVLKCTEIDTPGVFSIYGGNPNSMLVGESLTSMGDTWRFSWMIEGLFTGNVGIEEAVTSSVEFQLYPNPASDRFTLSGLPQCSDIEIVDINGRKVYTTQSTNSEMTIDDAHLNPGIYLVRVTSDKGVGVQRLVVK